MARRQNKAKEAVRIRLKTIANGNKSIYLDCYKDGKRSYEFLGLYIIPEKTKSDKILNENTMQAATAIKARRLIEIANGKAGISGNRQSDMLLSDWLKTYAEKKDGKSFRYQYQLKAVREAAGEVSRRTRKMTMGDIDKAFCIAFAKYLQTDYKGRLGKPLRQVTAHNYCALFNGAMNRAVRDGIISVNPYSLLEVEEKVTKPESQRVYLTTDEVKLLMDTEMPSARQGHDIKEAFLFACFTGLRLSDVRALTWGQINTDRGVSRLILKQQKTKRLNSFELSKQALRWMPERGRKGKNDNVFNIPTQTAIDRRLKDWACKAGIDKNVSFHTARHTFATMMLTLGADLYTVSKLLGHSDISTTQVYAKIIDKKKDEAVNLVDGIFND